MTSQQLDMLDLLPPTRPCAEMAVRCTSCSTCDDVPRCCRCDRQSNVEVCAFSWFQRRRAYVTHAWLLACWWHSGDVTDELRADVLALGPAYLIRWTAKPYGIVAGGTRAYADVETVAA